MIMVQIILEDGLKINFDYRDIDIFAINLKILKPSHP